MTTFYEILCKEFRCLIIDLNLKFTIFYLSMHVIESNVVYVVILSNNSQKGTRIGIKCIMFIISYE